MFLYDLFCHYSYDDFGVIRAPLSIRLTLGGHYRTSAFKRSAMWQASQRSPQWAYHTCWHIRPSHSQIGASWHLEKRCSGSQLIGECNGDKIKEGSWRTQKIGINEHCRWKSTTSFLELFTENGMTHAKQKIRNIWYFRSGTRSSNQQVCTPNSISKYLWLEFLNIY